MEDIQNEIVSSFGNKLRIRVCGICIEENKILLVRHHSIGKSGILWAPPGGGMIYGETSEQALIREFVEETGGSCFFLSCICFSSQRLHKKR